VGMNRFLLSTHWEYINRITLRIRLMFRARPALAILNKIRTIEIRGEVSEVSWPNLGSIMQKVLKPVVLVVLVTLLGFLISCSRHPSDEAIAQDIQTKVAADPETKNSDVSVAAKDGTIILSGKVTTQVAQQKLEQIARQEAGAARVEDQTAVQPVVVPAGTVLTVRVAQALGSGISQTGQTFLATLEQPVSVGEIPAIPAGSTLSGTVVTAKAKGKVKGQGELKLKLTRISVSGQTYSIQTNELNSTVKGKGKRTAVTTGGGAAGGALLGGLVGGGKGAGIGLLLGGGAGFVGGAMTGNKQIEVAAESALNFTLTSPLMLKPPTE
jgi:hypothetical protein